MNQPVLILFGSLMCLLLLAGPMGAPASPAEAEPVHPAADGGESPDEGWMFSAG